LRPGARRRRHGCVARHRRAEGGRRLREQTPRAASEAEAGMPKGRAGARRAVMASTPGGVGADRVRWDAEEYARNSGAQLGWARELIAKLELEGHEHVLDIGCGDGKVSAELARHVPGGRVVGVDSS